MRSQKSSFLLPLAALLIALIFVADVLTPLGYAEWTLYVVPVALCLFVGQAAAPLVAAFACSVLLGLGYVVARDSSGADVVLINRVLGAAAIWVVALVGTRFITARREIERLTWLERGKALISVRVAGVQQPEEIGVNALAALVEYTRCVTGVFYRVQDGQLLRIGASALAGEPAAVLPIGSGLAGQAVKEGKTRVVGPLDDDYLTVGSALGRMKPRALVVAPTRVDGEVNGVLEVAYLEPPAQLGLTAELLRASSDVIGVALHAAVSRIKLQNLLEETQRQGEELQTQQEELRVSNEELEEQGSALRESKEQLEQQQAELEQSNVQLEEYSNHLERQKQELLSAQKQLKANAEALARSNQFKSEFLANMSHELRTPLNSSLILSKLLADNADGSLSDVQVRYARTIHSSNHDLLNLINDILDLAKIEAGKVEVVFEQVALRDILEPLKATFEPVARQAKVGFRVDVPPGAPESVVTDLPRLLQILRNLLSNAFKFTREGEVTLQVVPGGEAGIRFAVRDTGIGIEPSKQQVIFDAFRQADGSTSRQYGGTGLGLSISRQLARLLQGTITVASVPDQGSTFTVSLPLAPVRQALRQEEANAQPDDFTEDWGEDDQYPLAPPPLPGFTSELKEAMDALTVTPSPGSQITTGHAAPDRAAQDTRRDVQPRRERTILLIEDDDSFAAVVKDLASDLDFECVITDSALEGLALARELQPRGILLDIGLPDRSGLAVLEQLKRDPATRPIPVHVVSASDHTQVALELGAIGYVRKPAMPEQLTQALRRVEDQSRRELKTVLIVEDDATLRSNLILLLQADRVELVGVGTISEALRLLNERSFDCMVMDLGLPDGSGFELLECMSKGGRYAFPPVIVYTGRTISRDEEQRLRRFSSSIIIKGARSPDRLVDEVTLFLHQVESNLPPDQQRLLKMARSRDSVLDGRKILLAEDDARNVFALVNVLEPLGAAVDVARNGREAVDKLRAGSSEVDLVLMDIMMPEMDGFAAMKAIRGDAQIGRVPIIALTANAMPEDRVKCLEAGANDYIAKPIDVDRLVSLCRVWMPK